MTQKKRVGGRRLPPNENLTGRAGVCRILQCDKRKVRRLEEKGILKPALVEPDGVRWFDLETVRSLAAAMQKNRRARAMPSALIEPCTGEETRAINEAFAANVPHWEICVRFRKSNETIRYMYAQYRTPSGGKLPTARELATMPDDYYPELEEPPAPRPTRRRASTAPTMRASAPAAENKVAAPQGETLLPPTHESKARRSLPSAWLEKDFSAPPSEPPRADPAPLAKTRAELPPTWLSDEFAPASER